MIVALSFAAKAAVWIAGIVVGTAFGALILVWWGISSTDEARSRRRR